MEWYRFISSGRVQHVFYRKFVSQAMMHAGFNGYIRNLDDGTVETVVFIEDDEADLQKAIMILKEGSPMSEIEDIRYETVDDIQIDTDGFEIRY
ncbi:acylphosphatase [Sulfurovum sp. ST-21]|uniref:acylphosphatase n=1 Tax=Sulfurovum indicum TaxID=2779528 RepID=A0A7M1S6G9_9BACT|nr:acylphosphatase [Sulfurovum indicum]QOR62754.1 acylphosphatase [Sulfurovum indicum]